MRSTVKVVSSTIRGRGDRKQGPPAAAEETNAFIDDIDFAQKALESSSRRKRTITFGVPIIKPVEVQKVV